VVATHRGKEERRKRGEEEKRRGGKEGDGAFENFLRLPPALIVRWMFVFIAYIRPLA
jgi:hypothetical protein